MPLGKFAGIYLPSSSCFLGGGILYVDFHIFCYTDNQSRLPGKSLITNQLCPMAFEYISPNIFEIY
jgi:hypothetical protein